MKHKKRDRDLLNEEKCDSDPLTNDHELFLQAFEKPTQIYRYLRARHMVLPIFLHRCLSFMNRRSARNNKRRRAFSIDSMLKDVENRQRKQGGESYKPDYLNITVSEFSPHELRGLKGPVQVEVSLLKTCPNRRKESSTSSVQLGVVSVPLDSAHSSSSQSRVISVASDHFQTSPSPPSGVLAGSARTYILRFRARCAQCKQLNGYHIDEPAPKRPRLSANNQRSEPPISSSGNFSAELTVYDKHRKCLLLDGDYELSMTEEAVRTGRSATWETVNDERLSGPFSQFERMPALKFRVSWSRAAGGVSTRSSIVTHTENGIDNNNSTVVQEILSQSKPELFKTSPTKFKEALILNNNGLSNGLCQRVYYQFSYNSYLRQQTESRHDYHCPWCAMNCLDLYPLLKHLRLSHSRFNFSLTPSALGACIDVSLNECYDGGYVGNPQDTQSHLGYAFCRHGPVQRTPLTHVIVARPKRPAPSLSEFMEEEECETVKNKQIIQGHNRLYYHTVTNRPIKPCEIDDDSEGENDPEWLKQKTVLMIDEFTDVNAGEKEIMKLWNLHVMKYNYIGDCQLSSACRRFVEEHAQTISEKKLHRNLTAHLINLSDAGLVGPDTVLNCTLLLYSLEERS